MKVDCSPCATKQEEAELWECAFVNKDQIEEVLGYVKEHPRTHSLTHCSSSQHILELEKVK